MPLIRFNFCCKVAFVAAAGLSSFGLIGHSQGGAVSLHLMNFYHSGLDAAVGYAAYVFLLFFANVVFPLILFLFFLFLLFILLLSLPDIPAALARFSLHRRLITATHQLAVSQPV